MNMYISGKWTGADDVIEVINPYDKNVVDTVPSAGADQVEAALASAETGSRVMADLPGHRRAEILNHTADLLMERFEEFARTLTLEVGKPIEESRTEVSRAATVLRLSAEEAGRLFG